MATLYEYYNTGDDHGFETYWKYWLGQTFTVGSVAHTITSVKIKAYRVGEPENGILSIRATDGEGLPTGGDLTSGAFSTQDFALTPPGAWYDIPVTEITLSANTKYAIVIRLPDATSEDCLNWRSDKTDPTYTGGNLVNSGDFGVTWASNPTYDQMFEIWGNPIENVAPTNDQLVLDLSGAQYKGTKTLLAQKQDYTFTHKVSDDNGVTDITYAQITLDYDGKNIILRATRGAGDTWTFSEYSDPSNYVTLNVGACTHSTSGNQKTFNYKVKINWNWGYTAENITVRAYVIDGENASDTDDYSNVFGVENRLEAANLRVCPSSMVLLVHGDGPDEDPNFYDDATGKTVTTVGSAQVDTAQKVFGTGSILFEGSDDYLTLADDADWTFGANPFTIGFRVRFNNLPAVGAWMYFVIHHQGSDYDNRWYFILYNNGGTYQYIFGVVSGGAGLISVTANSPGLLTNTWYHIALVRTGNYFKIFQNGTQCGDTVEDDSAIPDFSGLLYVGINFVGLAREMDGWIDELCIRKGKAEWTENFTPPSVPYDPYLVSENESLDFTGYWYYYDTTIYPPDGDYQVKVKLSGVQKGATDTTLVSGAFFITANAESSSGAYDYTTEATYMISAGAFPTVYVTVYVYEENFTLDTLLKHKDITETVDLSMLLQKYNLLETVDLEALVQKQDIPETADLEALVQKQDIPETVDLEALVKKRIRKTIDLDTRLLRRNIAELIYLDMILGVPGTQIFSLTALLKKLKIPVTFDLDMLLAEALKQQTIDLDMILKAVKSLTVSLTMLLKKKNIPETVDLDTILVKSETETFDLEMLLKKLKMLETVTLDMIVVEQAKSQLIDLDMILVTRHLATATLDMILQWRKRLTVYMTMHLWKKNIPKTLDLDTIIKTIQTATADLDTIIMKIGSQSVELDALIKLRNIVVTYTLDMILKSIKTESIDLDMILKTIKTVTINLSMILQNRDQSASTSLDMILIPYVTLSGILRISKNQSIMRISRNQSILRISKNQSILRISHGENRGKS